MKIIFCLFFIGMIGAQERLVRRATSLQCISEFRASLIPKNSPKQDLIFYRKLKEYLIIQEYIQDAKKVGTNEN